MNVFNPITKDSVRELFLNYFKALEIPIIDYVAIGVQNSISKNSASLMSNSEWQHVFVTTQRVVPKKSVLAYLIKLAQY